MSDTPRRPTTGELTLDMLARVQESTEAHRELLGKLERFMHTPPSRLERKRLTTDQPSATVEEHGSVESVGILNFSASTVDVGIAGRSADASNGIPVDAESYLVLPVRTNMVDVAASVGDLTANGPADVVVLLFQHVQPLTAGPLIPGTSGALGTDVNVTDRAGRLVGHVTVDNATLAVTGNVEVANDVGNPLPVSDAGASLTVDDGGGSLTVDGTVGVSGNVEVTNDVGNPLPVSDGGGSLTVDGTVEVTNDSGNPLPVSAAADVSQVFNGVTALTPKRAFANVAASQTDSSIVTGVATKKLRVLAAFAVAGGTATNLTFNSKGAGAGTAISPLIANGPNGGEVLPFNPVGWFETNAGEALTVTTAAGSTTGILVVYVEV